MKKVWKWIIGIVIGLVVLAVLVGVGFMVFSHTHAVRIENGYARGWPQQGPGMMPYNHGFGGHMGGLSMMNRGGMMPFGGFIGGLICLGILALVAFGIIMLVRAMRKSNAAATPAAGTGAAPMPAEPMETCKKCGKPLQSDWKNCPYCGKKV